MPDQVYVDDFLPEYGDYDDLTEAVDSGVEESVEEVLAIAGGSGDDDS